MDYGEIALKYYQSNSNFSEHSYMKLHKSFLTKERYILEHYRQLGRSLSSPKEKLLEA